MAQYFMNEKDAGIIRDTVKRVAAGWTPRPQVTPNHREPVTDTEVEGGISGNLYSQQWVMDTVAQTLTCIGGYILVNGLYPINLAGFSIPFTGANMGQALFILVNQDFTVQGGWYSDLTPFSKPAVPCLIFTGGEPPVSIIGRYYEQVLYMATNPVLGVDV